MQLPIRVSLVGLAPLVRDIVHTLIASEPDMCVAAIMDDVQDARVSESAAADVYLLGIEPSNRDTRERLLGDAHSPYRVIGVSADGREMQVSELLPATSVLGSLSSVELLALIRRSGRHDAPAEYPPLNEDA